MKKIYFVFLYSFIMLFFSCAKQEIDPDHKVSVGLSQTEGIECIDGVLHFNSAKICMATMDSLLSNENYRTDFEKNYNFTSLATETDEKITILSSIENESIRNAALEEFKEYIYQDKDSLLLPVIPARGYAVISNKEGVFYINDIKHFVNKNHITIEKAPEYETKSFQSRKYTYIIDEGTKVLNQTRNVDIRYETNKRRVFAKVYTYQYIFVEQPPQSRFETTYCRYSMQIHVSGHKKSFGWNTYKTNFTVEELAFKYVLKHHQQVVTIAQGSVTSPLGPYRSNEVRNFYIDFPLHEFHEGGAILYECSVEEAKFRFRARSNGTGYCGAIIEQITDGVHLPLQNCQ